jgi:uncharacterized secreted protein with C-terminal beta-propeller domain
MGRFSSRARLALSATAIGLVFVAASVAIGAAAVGAQADRARPAVRTAHGDLTPFASCDRLRGYLRRHRVALQPLVEGPIAIEDTAGNSVVGAPAAGEAPSSPTNVQEEGVDEPDLVKASGSTIFAVAGDRLRAVDASGATPAVVDSIKLPDGPGEYASADDHQLLVSGDRALVISRSYGTDVRTLLTEVDVSDPAAMRELETLTADGNYVSARLTATTVRVVVSSLPSVPIAERGRGRAFLPGAVLHDRVAGESSRGKLVGCHSVRRPKRFSGGEMLSVLTIDLARGLEPVDTDAVMAGGEIVYGSPTSLYVATQRWLGPDASPQRSSDVTTAIHRFDTADPDSTQYVASGEVDGYMLSQWSMSEQDGVLRVASTTSPPWADSGQAPEGGGGPAKSESLITTLAPDGDRLVEVGRLGGLGEGEQIYAVRFIGDLGYVVTFRQVDPLYTVDLADPTRPRVVGQLKIPGYSAYLHPVGPGLLLGVGQDATSEGQTTGVQVSLFDVTDPAAPTRIDRVTLGAATSSEVEYDHHAFTYSPELGLAVVPIEDYLGAEGFYGAVGVHVDAATGLTRTRRTTQGSSYESAIRRSLVLDGRLLTVSSTGVGVHDPSTLERLALTRFAAG